MTQKQITHLQDMNVETLSDLGSIMNIYLSIMTAIILIAFGLDNIFYK